MLKYELYIIGGQCVYPWYADYDTKKPAEKHVMYAVPPEFDGDMEKAIEIDVPESIMEKLRA